MDTTSRASKSDVPCRFFKSVRGCKFGASCRYLHDEQIPIVTSERLPYHRLPRPSRVAVGVSTLVLNVLPWDVATYPSGAPEHFVPYDFVLEEVTAYLAPDTWTFQYASERHEREGELDEAKRSLHTVAGTVKSSRGYHTDITTQGVVEGTQCIGLTLHSKHSDVHDIGVANTWLGPDHNVYNECPNKLVYVTERLVGQKNILCASWESLLVRQVCSNSHRWST